MSTVEIVLKEGPISITSLAGSGVDSTFSLWNGICASEFFPSNVQSAFYFLSLRKSVNNADEVGHIENELVSAIRLLAMAWPFSGGSYMSLDSREVIVSDRFQSNAVQVQAAMLAAAGKKVVSSSVTAPLEFLATYDRPPLHIASIVAEAATNNYGLRKLMEYYQAAWTGYYQHTSNDRHSWFIDLYKVRDLLQKLHGNDAQATKMQLAISKADWGFFGDILNNSDLRHAEVTGIAPCVRQQDIDKLYRLARTWTLAYLKTLGLPIL